MKEYYYHDKIGVRIVEEGLAVFVIENRGYGERAMGVGSLCDGMIGKQYWTRCSGQLFDNIASSLGIDLRTLYISDSNQVIQYIRSLDYIDTEKIAIAGFSLGSFIAKDVAIVNPYVKATLLVSGTGVFINSFGPVTSASVNFEINPERNALLAPRPLYLSWGEEEKVLFAYELATHHTANFLTEVYQLLDAEENLEIIFHEGDHRFDIPSFLDFLKKTLLDIDKE